MQALRRKELKLWGLAASEKIPMWFSADTGLIWDDILASMDEIKTMVALDLWKI